VVKKQKVGIIIIRIWNWVRLASSCPHGNAIHDGPLLVSVFYRVLRTLLIFPFVRGIYRRKKNPSKYTFRNLERTKSWLSRIQILFSLSSLGGKYFPSVRACLEVCNDTSTDPLHNHTKGKKFKYIPLYTWIKALMIHKYIYSLS
jgi:hypothetical protein